MFILINYKNLSLCLYLFICSKENNKNKGIKTRKNHKKKNKKSIKITLR